MSAKISAHSLKSLLLAASWTFFLIPSNIAGSSFPFVKEALAESNSSVQAFLLALKNAANGLSAAFDELAAIGPGAAVGAGLEIDP